MKSVCPNRNHTWPGWLVRKAGRALTERHKPGLLFALGAVEMEISFSYEGKVPYKPTPMKAKIEKRVREWRDKIVRERLDPWRLRGAHGGIRVHVTMHSGKPIHLEGTTFDGSPQHVFWSSDFMPPFLEDAIEDVFQEVAGICREHGFPPEDYLAEAVGYLNGMVGDVYDTMARIDARLTRGPRRHVFEEYVRPLLQRVQEHRQAARLLAGQNPVESVTQPTERHVVGHGLRGEGNTVVMVCKPQPQAWYVFNREGATWRIRYEGEEKTVKHSKGMKYIQHLIRNKGTAIGCKDLFRAFDLPEEECVRKVDAGEARELGLSQGGFDKQEFSRQPRDIQDKGLAMLDQLHERETDPTKQAEIREQIEECRRLLNGNINRWGKPRAEGLEEDARKSVRMAIKRAQGSLRKKAKPDDADSPIGKHFDVSIIRDGSTFSYRPDREIPWVFK